MREIIEWFPFPQTHPPNPGSYMTFILSQDGKGGVVTDVWCWNETKRVWEYYDYNRFIWIQARNKITYWAERPTGPSLQVT